jgi:hypothetical protein
MALTSEELKKLFKSNFELARYAIQWGRYEIKAGREPSLDRVLEEIRRHPDPSYLEDLKAIDLMDND